MDSDVQYARNGGVAIAYRVMGAGEQDLVSVPEFMSNLVYDLESTSWRPFYERLAQSWRLILFDKRGTGLSDHGSHYAALETRMEDLAAVLDAVGSRSAIVLAGNEGCAMAALFAATYPERVRALVLFHPAVRGQGTDSRESQEELRDIRLHWGERDFLDDLLRTGCPTLHADPAERERFADECRVGASPEVAYALNRAHYETDLRDVLPAIHVPTLVLHRPAPFGAEADALAVAELIPHARAMRISHSDYFGIQLSLDIADEIEAFMSGEAPQEVPTSVLTTVMFTDLVGSTEQASALGDRRWRDVLAAHHAVVRRELARFRGEERDTAGDGFFATFDGPARAIRAAQEIVKGLARLDLRARIGIHVGECELHDGKPSGLAVNIGARVAALGGPGQVLVTRTVRDLVAGSGFSFEAQGSHALKGVPGQWDVFGLAPNGSEDTAPER